MMDAVQHPSMPVSGFWRTLSTAFTSASLIAPPPMASHMFHRSKVNTIGTIFSTFDCSENQKYISSSSHLFFTNKFLNKGTEKIETKADPMSRVTAPRIAIIGGGIAGVTAADAIVKRLKKEQKNNVTEAKIVLFEADTEGGQRSVTFDSCQQPVWTAATARNANSMVPGAAMHVMSQRSTLAQICKDTCQEIAAEFLEKMKSYVNISFTSNIENFDIKPPYFALHLFRCIGPSASWDERMTFVEFLRHFVIISALTGEKEAHERGEFIQQLAKSNRLMFLDALNSTNDKELADKMGSNKGFLSLHRTRKAALHAEQEGKDFNEPAEMIPIEDAIALEPRISNLPMAKSLFAVHRKNDYTANSAVFVQDLVKQIKSMGVEYRCGNNGAIQGISARQHIQKSKVSREYGVLATSSRDLRFKITTEDGASHNFDYVVLAAGVNTPLLAKKLEIENVIPSIFRSSICPTYPLRGYSCTVYTNHTKEKDGNDRMKKGLSPNLLNRPISVDDMYCSSVGVNMARIAGFGELVGYRDKAINVPSLAPKVMARYAKTIFPDSDVTDDTALQCFRPMTPDDIPLVGEVGSVPGLFLHTGHGTLGWTLCLATAECVAQALCDDLAGKENRMEYQLPGGLTVDREKLSPNRFM